MSRFVFYLKSFAVVAFAFMAPFFFCTTKTFAADPSGSKGNPISISSNTNTGEVTNLLKTSLINRDKKVRIYVKKSNSNVDLDVVNNTVKADVFVYQTGASYAAHGDYLAHHTISINSRVGIDDGVYYIQYNMAYLDTPSEATSADSNVSSILQGLSLSGKTQFQKHKIIRNYLIEQFGLDFSYDNDSGGLSYGSQKAIAYDYAWLYCRLIIATSNSCRVITGKVEDNQGDQRDYAWSIAKLGSYWYNIDIASDILIAQYDGGFTQYEHEESCFLYSNANFQNYIRDPEFNTESFNSSYPMTAKSYDAGSTKNPYGCDNHPHRTLGRF